MFIESKNRQGTIFYTKKKFKQKFTELFILNCLTKSFITKNISSTKKDYWNVCSRKKSSRKRLKQIDGLIE
jgi:hypothetical protein